MTRSPCRRYRIRGRVQGVFFRDSTRAEALALGLDGHAVNLAAGTVEVLACGPEEALDALGHWLERGPPQARVDAVETAPSEAVPPRGFTIG